MNYFTTKQQGLLKRRSSSVNASSERKRSGLLSASDTNRTNTFVQKTANPLKLPTNQNNVIVPKPATRQSKPAVPPRQSSKTPAGAPKPNPPPVAPRTKPPEKPIPAERKLLNKANTNSSVDVTIMTIVTEKKSPQLIVSSVTSTNPILSEQKLSTTKTVSQSTSYTPGLCGLINIGNTCFMNSALQCLSNIPEFTRWAQDQKAHLTTQNDDIIHAYTFLIQSMWSGENESITPRDIKAVVSRSAPIFADYGQKDSHEFLNSLLNALERTNVASIISNLFRIRTQSQVTCSACSIPDTTDETTTFLPLPLPEIVSNNGGISLEELIKDYCSEDTLDGLYYCHTCSKYSQAKQKTNICSPLPPVLIIQLKRFPFDGSFRKINTFVRYKLQHKNLISENDIYQLCAVSCHSGNLAGGHYTTLARNYLKKQWYLFNDSHVERMNSDEVITNDAYVLVYLKADNWDNSLP